MNEAANPPRSDDPMRATGRDIVAFITKNLGRAVIKKWEVTDDGKIQFYFGVIHHNPNWTKGNSLLLRIMAASEVFNIPFRVYPYEGTICVEMNKELL